MKRTLLFIMLTVTSMLFSQNFKVLDDAINKAIADSVFPGAVVCVGQESNFIYNKAYGHYTYDSSSPKVNVNTMYDMASVTKAFATNLCMMKLVDEGKISLDEKVSHYLPDFAQNGKENVKVIDLLIHESGLQPYYSPQEGQTREDLINAIMSLPLSYETNTNTKYSCLNFVTAMLVIESVIDKPMYQYYRDTFTSPMGLNSTMFIPGKEYKDRIIPTTPDVQGIVHDPLARGLEGRSGNAGLFSTGEDLSKLCQMLINKGEFNGKRYFSKEIVEKFSKCFSDRSTRAIGFDTRSVNGKSSSGKYFSNGTYGHLGFTGTSIWIDPVRKLYTILLTNRVYPDESSSISKTRPAVYDAVIISLEGPKE